MKKTWFCLRLGAGMLVFCLLFAGVSAFMLGAMQKAQPAAAQPSNGVVFVLDAGHGGEDCGALGADGTQEKTLNMAITRMLGDMLQAAGQTVVYTRTEDRLLYTEEQNIRGKRKMYDLRNRLI